jgi:ABC-type transport system involved in cytochrome bd biosynthesis fused ATPase/permease subunit
LSVADLRVRWPDGAMVTLGTELLLPPGRRVALVSGSRVAASALAAVLLRLLEYEGTATLNGVELRDLAADDVRGVIGICARDTQVLPTTIAANVRTARPDAADDQVADALRRAGLDLPPDAVVDDRHHALSAVDRRRLALARVLLADVPVLILDEPTAEADVLAAAKGRTLLLVTHEAAVPGATPILRHVDEVITLSGR